MSQASFSEPITAERLRSLTQRGKAQFRSAEPFEHVVFDDFLEPDFAAALLSEFKASRGSEHWTYYHHYNEKKRGLSELAYMGPATRRLFDYLHSDGVVKALEEMTGIGGLLADPDMDGAGIYETEPGGFLNMHIDFLSHRKRKTWSRQLNMIYFLNQDWRESYNGHLELWDRQMRSCVKKILPVFNRCVIFHTSTRAYHGVPQKVACPEGDSRKSIALYYYKDEGHACRTIPTYYRALPTDSPVKKSLVVADRLAVGVYSYLQRSLGFSDSVLGKFLKLLG